MKHPVHVVCYSLPFIG